MRRELITDLAVLSKPSEPCASVSEGVRIGRELTRFLESYNRRAKFNRGVGLAAIQLGIPKRACVIMPPGLPSRILVNPEITDGSPFLVEAVESCLSFPGKEAKTFRHGSVDFTAINIPGTHRSRSALEAAIIQHEVGHTLGLTFYDFGEEKSWVEVLEAKGLVVSLPTRF